jgi:flagellar hook protein FlgE
MSFNTALSGLRAASTDLNVTGNNISNAGTIGFKSSRTEFGDVYGSSLLGGGSNTPGSGVSTLNVRQQFSQGNLKFTQNGMDLAVNGTGFFVLQNSEGRAFSRAGAFGLDKEGNIVNSTGAHLQGFSADASGNISGIISDLVVNVTTQAPRQTTGVQSAYNLDSNQLVLESAGTTFASNGTAIGVAQTGASPVTNGYVPQTLTIQGPTGSAINYTSTLGASAAKTASELNALAGVSATARTTATVAQAGFSNPATSNLRLNGVVLTSTTLAGLATEINLLTTTTLPGISATVNTSGDLDVVSSVGADLSFSFAGPGAGGAVTVTGTNGGPQTVNNLTNSAVVGGSFNVVLDSGYTVTNSVPAVGNLFTALTPASFSPVVVNAFDPADQRTYNHATSSTVYDSLGNAHVMRSFFVKQRFDPTDPTTLPGHWKMYVQIDGKDVGDPNPNLPSPANTVPTVANFDMYFTADGNLNKALTDTVLISNWTPIGTDGKSVGALPPLNILQGATTPVIEPPTSSNFLVDLVGSTQFGSPFSVENLNQNGYAVGRLAGLDVDAKGIVFARFSNGESQTLGQVALAKFNNVEGLAPIGNTMWAQTFETGEAVIGVAGSSSLGNIDSGALEESNVDLSEELVNLIIAQRNYQANAKTIETENATTQTILNIR